MDSLFCDKHRKSKANKPRDIIYIIVITHYAIDVTEPVIIGNQYLLQQVITDQRYPIHDTFCVHKLRMLIGIMFCYKTKYYRQLITIV